MSLMKRNPVPRCPASHCQRQGLLRLLLSSVASTPLRLRLTPNFPKAFRLPKTNGPRMIGSNLPLTSTIHSFLVLQRRVLEPAVAADHLLLLQRLLWSRPSRIRRLATLISDEVWRMIRLLRQKAGDPAMVMVAMARSLRILKNTMSLWHRTTPTPAPTTLPVPIGELASRPL